MLVAGRKLSEYITPGALSGLPTPGSPRVGIADRSYRLYRMAIMVLPIKVVRNIKSDAMRLRLLGRYRYCIRGRSGSRDLVERLGLIKAEGVLRV